MDKQKTTTIRGVQQKEMQGDELARAIRGAVNVRALNELRLAAVKSKDSEILKSWQDKYRFYKDQAQE